MTASARRIRRSLVSAALASFALAAQLAPTSAAPAQPAPAHNPAARAPSPPGPPKRESSAPQPPDQRPAAQGQPAESRQAQAQPAPEAARSEPARRGSVLPGGDSREPVVIDADKLEWLDKEQKAIYTGNVVATQGESTLKAAQLRIFLLRADKNAAPAAGGPGGDNQIDRMEADGPVELIQKDQTATGDNGLYERARNTVTLTGHVALKQGGNTTYGDRLVYDLDTRQAVVQNPRGTFAPRAAPDAAAPKR